MADNSLNRAWHCFLSKVRYTPEYINIYKPISNDKLCKRHVVIGNIILYSLPAIFILSGWFVMYWVYINWYGPMLVGIGVGMLIGSSIMRHLMMQMLNDFGLIAKHKTK